MDVVEKVINSFIDELRNRGQNPIEGLEGLLDQIIQIKKGGSLEGEVAYPDVIKEIVIMSNDNKRQAIYDIIRKMPSHSWGQHCDPKFVVDFVNGIAQVLLKNKPSKIADITSGLGSSIGSIAGEVSVEEACSYELMENLVKIQRKIMLVTNTEVKVYQSNIITDEIPNSYFDLIAFNPPMGAKVEKDKFKKENSLLLKNINSTSDLDLMALDRALGGTKPGGFIITVLPAGFLFKGGVTQKVRAELLKQAHVKAIISMPNQVFWPYSGVNTCTLVLQKRDSNLQEPANVIMVDLSHINLGPRYQNTRPRDIPEYNQLLELLSKGGDSIGD